MHHWNDGPRLKAATTSGKQENTQQDHQANRRAGDCTQSKSRKCWSPGKSLYFVRTDRKKDLYCLHPVVSRDVEKTVDDSKPGQAGTPLGNRSGRGP
jgi:hypothetical protein